MAVITGTARPGEFLVSDTAGQWAINGVPLIGHTGYRLLVPWTAVPGDLITQGEVSNTVPVPAYDADAADYFSRAETAGGSFLSEGVPGWYIKWRIDAMYRRLKDTGAWDAIAELYLMMGVDFGGLGAKAKYHSDPSITWHGLVSGDYAATGVAPGVQFTPAKRGDTSFTFLEDGIDPVNVGLGALITDNRETESSTIAIGLRDDDSTAGNLSVWISSYRVTMRLLSRSAGFLDYGLWWRGTPATAWRWGSAAGQGGMVVGDSALVPTTAAATVFPDGRAASINGNDTHYGGSSRQAAGWMVNNADEQQVRDLHAAISQLMADLDQSPYPRRAIVIRAPMKDVMRNSTGNRATVRLIDSYGEPLTGIPAGDVTITAGPEGGTAVPVAVAGSWTERSGGRYDFAMPDAMYTGTERIYVEGTLAGGTVLGDCHQIVGYDRLEPWATPSDIAAIGAVIPGDDAQTLTITCTADSQPVAGVVIRIAGRRLVTDTAGVATVDLDPGSYTAKYTPPAGFSAVPDGAIVIAAAPVGVAVSLTPTSISPVDEPLCPVRFVARTQFAEPARGMSVRVEFMGFVPGGSAAGVVVNIPNSLSISNDDAYVDTGLYRQARYQATFARSSWGASKSVVFVTPAEGGLVVTEPA